VQAGSRRGRPAPWHLCLRAACVSLLRAAPGPHQPAARACAPGAVAARPLFACGNGVRCGPALRVTGFGSRGDAASPSTRLGAWADVADAGAMPRATRSAAAAALAPAAPAAPERVSLAAAPTAPAANAATRSTDDDDPGWDARQLAWDPYTMVRRGVAFDSCPVVLRVACQRGPARVPARPSLTRAPARAACGASGVECGRRERAGACGMRPRGQPEGRCRSGVDRARRRTQGARGGWRPQVPGA
jgi:hypothetical protein